MEVATEDYSIDVRADTGLKRGRIAACRGACAEDRLGSLAEIGRHWVDVSRIQRKVRRIKRKIEVVKKSSECI